jgi:hypothetical protein
MDTAESAKSDAPRDNSVGAGLYIVAGFGLVCMVLALVSLRGASRRLDFNIYYACAVALHQGMDPYAVDLMILTRQLHLRTAVLAHPADTPTFTLITAPLAMASPPIAYAVWFSASMLALSGSLYLLLGPSSQLDRKTTILFSMAALGFTPLAFNIFLGQSQTFVLFGVMLFYRLLQRGRDSWAGALLAALGLLRGYPLVLGGYLIVQRRWRAIVVLAIAFAIGAAATVATIGVAPVENFLHVIGFVGGHGWFTLTPIGEVTTLNLSLNAFLKRPLILLSGNFTHTGMIAVLVVLAELAILASTFLTTANISAERAFPIWVVMMLILTPVIWLYYLTLLIIPFGMIAVAATHHRSSVRVWRLAIRSYCALVLLTPPIVMLTFRRVSNWRMAAFGELGFLALFSVWVACRRFASETL